MTCDKSTINISPIPNIWIKDLTGQQFADLTVLGFMAVIDHISVWWCQCKCGNISKVRGGKLTGGHTRSCGCRRNPHGMAGTRTYKSWQGMRQRCNNPNDAHFSNYGERGICVCRRWDASFVEFLSDMGERPTNTTLDRIDNDGHYSCGKCDECIENGWTFNGRWGTPKVQSNNTRYNHHLTWNDRTQTMAEWADELNVSRQVLYQRIKRGWSEVDTLSIPIKHSLR